MDAHARLLPRSHLLVPTTQRFHVTVLKRFRSDWQHGHGSWKLKQRHGLQRRKRARRSGDGGLLLTAMLGACGKIERVGVQPLIKRALALPSQPRSAKSISTPLQLRLDKPLLACQSVLSLPPHSRSSNTTLSRPPFSQNIAPALLHLSHPFPSPLTHTDILRLSARLLLQLIIT